MNPPEPQHPCVERTIALIYEAFDGVTREGGVSLTEAELLDGRPTDEELEAARLEDKDQRWQELIDGTHGVDFSADLYFAYLDPIGFRYYLAPAMVAALRYGYDNGIDFWLDVNPEEPGESSLERISLLTNEQSQTVCEYLKCAMLARSRPEVGAVVAYQFHWAALDQNPI